MNNLVFIKHLGDPKYYLFGVPMSIQLRKGDKVFCDTMYTRQLGECVTDSFYIDDTSKECVITGVGAYKPLKRVVGYAMERKVYEQALFDASLPF